MRRFYFEIHYNTGETSEQFAQDFEKADLLMTSLKNDTTVKYFVCNEILQVRSFSVVVLQHAKAV